MTLCAELRLQAEGAGWSRAAYHAATAQMHGTREEAGEPPYELGRCWSA
jgi:hypothetical protein